MNFFGHAVVALEQPQKEDPAFVLGAMLPDFGSMIGARIEHVEDAALHQGVVFHHAVDAVFHDAAAFRALSSASFQWFEARDLQRGSARALAHVGVELLLDRVLARESHYREGYMQSFEAAPRASSVALVDLARVQTGAGTASQRLAALLERLAAFGVDLHVCSLSTLATRLERILARRPRLALTERDAAYVLPWLEAFEASSERAAADVMADLRHIQRNSIDHV